jgi:uncharacterized protein (TIGR02147 family)
MRGHSGQRIFSSIQSIKGLLIYSRLYLEYMRPLKEYMEYRDFLRDFYEENKNQKPYFSFRYMGNKLSIDPSHLAKIFQKQRHVGENTIQPLIKFCDLKDSDAEYFETLIRFNKAKSEREYKMFFDKLLALKGVKAEVLESNKYEFYTKWYYTAVLSLLDFFPFSDDYKALATKISPPITENETRKAIAVLEKLELIKRNPDGFYTPTKQIITTGEPVRTAAIRAFQLETIRLAGESLSRHPKEKRNISTVTITVSEDTLEKLNEMIKIFRENSLKLAKEEKNSEKVYQLNIQLFPLSD